MFLHFLPISKEIRKIVSNSICLRYNDSESNCMDLYSSQKDILTEWKKLNMYEPSGIVRTDARKTNLGTYNYSATYISELWGQVTERAGVSIGCKKKSKCRKLVAQYFSASRN